MTAHRIRSGFTFVELLVVIAAIAILLALSLTATQRIRETANRASCGNNFRQVGQAVLAHQDKFGIFPDAGGTWTDSRSYNASGVPEVAPKQTWGFWYQILPFLDNTNAWAGSDDVAAGLVLPIYFCPTRRPPCAYPGIENGNLISFPNLKRGAIDFAGNGGAFAPIFPEGATDLTLRRNGVVIPRLNGDHVSLSNIPDGPSNTILAGERNFNLQRAGDWTQYDENDGYFNGWDWDVIRWGNSAPAPDRRDNSNSDIRFGSSHPGGLNVLLADGSVRFLTFDIDLDTFQRLCIRNDGDPIPATTWR